jgi:glycosyltransferase involved in cell wall biosynthesis
LSFSKTSLLLLTDWFTPGYRAGGPIQSCHNFVLGMQHVYPIQVLTTNKDLGDEAPYPHIPTQVWLPFEGNSQVMYLPANRLGAWQIAQILRQSKPTVVYLNSMFSLYFTIVPLVMYWLGLLSAKVVLAPRGMLKASALQFKARKKQVFLRLFRWSGLAQRIVFHATDAQEKKDIERVFGAHCQIVVIPSFPPPIVPLLQPKIKSNPVRFVFIGRIHPIKNLHFALQCLAACKLAVHFSIIGNIEDAGYWQQCKELIIRLPAHVRVDYLGEMPHPEVKARLADFDFLLLPTQGENFGHAIFECFAAGIPVLISDQTPWLGLQELQAGWSLPLDGVAGFVSALEQAAAMRAEEYVVWSGAAQAYARAFVAQAGLEEAYRGLFDGNAGF